jgi:hypothetical protein
MFLGKEKRHFSAGLIATFCKYVVSHSLAFKSPLSMIALTTVRNRNDKV